MYWAQFGAAISRQFVLKDCTIDGDSKMCDPGPPKYLGGRAMASGLSEQMITRASDVPQAIPRVIDGAGGSGHRSRHSCMGNVGLPRRVESSLSPERFTLKLEALQTGRGLGRGFRMLMWWHFI